MSNLTYMEDDAFINLDDKVVEMDQVTSILRMVWRITSQILKLVLCCSSAGASVFLIYIISKVNKLRRSNNIFVLHYAIANSIDILVLPLFVVINEIVGGMSGWIRWETGVSVIRHQRFVIYFGFCFRSYHRHLLVHRDCQKNSVPKLDQF
jgi:hypothetical protein